MNCTCRIGSFEYEFTTDQVWDLSIGLRFNGEQPNAYGIGPATSTAYSNDNFVADTRQGGACNVALLSLVPHANGTHTECIGHLTDQPVSINKVFQPGLITAILITVEPRSISDTSDTYSLLDATDKLICLNDLEEAINKIEIDSFEAIIIRTLPNGVSKKHRSYQKDRAAFFSTESMGFLAALKIKHLLTDLPSIDRDDDGGKLPNHRLYWNMAETGHELNGESRSERTITEFVFAPAEVPDGSYLLDLQIAPFETDAAPSRPLIYPITKIN